MSEKIWEIITKDCKGKNFRNTLLQGVNLIMLHNFVRNRGTSNYMDSETEKTDREWFENEIDELVKLLRKDYRKNISPSTFKKPTKVKDIKHHGLPGDAGQRYM